MSSPIELLPVSIGGIAVYACVFLFMRFGYKLDKKKRVFVLITISVGICVFAGRFIYLFNKYFMGG